MTGLVPPLPFRQTEWSLPPRSDHACVPPPSAAINQTRFPLRHTAGAVKRSVPDGVETSLQLTPLVRPRAAQPPEREEPDLPVLATLRDHASA